MKKVILLGATSNISTYLIPHLLEQSDVELTLFARQATRRLGQYADNQRISLIDGNWNNPADLTAAIAGQEIVYLATGHFTKANQQVVTAMKQNGVAMKTVKIIVNGQTFTANFEENATASELLSQMPMTLPMLNLYSRELTYRFKQALPANEAHTSGYTVGDIAYWKPRHSFVIFYKQTSEVIGDLQQIGHINTSHLAQFQSLGNVEMRFEKEDLNS